MDEFGEFHAFYIWPEGHRDGESLPEDFRERLAKVLTAGGFGWESV